MKTDPREKAGVILDIVCETVLRLAIVMIVGSVLVLVTLRPLTFRPPAVLVLFQ